MRIINGTVSGVSRLARLQVELSRKARQRLKWFDYYKARGHNARLTCHYFGTSPQAFHRWKKLYNPRHIASLSEACGVARAPWWLERCGKDKVVVLHDEGFTCSASTVSRILNRLKDELLEWKQVYNTIRPHQALGYVTPLKFLGEWKECQERRMCH